MNSISLYCFLIGNLLYQLLDFFPNYIVSDVRKKTFNLVKIIFLFSQKLFPIFLCDFYLLIFKKSLNNDTIEDTATLSSHSLLFFHLLTKATDEILLAITYIKFGSLINILNGYYYYDGHNPKQWMSIVFFLKNDIHS